MTLTSRTRSKPLRTYGKRSASTPDPRGDGPLKRRRTRLDEVEAESPKSKLQCVDAAPLTENAPPKLQDGAAIGASLAKVAFTKGSIMNYFKPSPTPLSANSSSPTSDEVQPSSSPLSSPPTVQQKSTRKPRILRFRGTSLPNINADELEGKEEGESKAKGEDEEQEHDHGDEEEGYRERGEKSPRHPLQDRKETLSNQSIAKDKPKKPPRSKSVPTVQTTLNISAQAPFSECKICDTVWNPLHPDDVKYHAKQHASVLRAKRKKKEEDEL